MGRLHVLFLASWYPNKLKPLNGNFIKQHAEAVSEYCFVSVIHVRARKQEQRFILDINEQENMKEYVCYYKKHLLNIPFFSFFLKIKQKLSAYKFAYAQIRKNSPAVDIAHVNVILPSGIFALFLKRTFKIPFVITEHWTRFLNSSGSGFSFFEKMLIKKIARKSAMICPVSENLKETLVRFGLKTKYSVVPNVVNTEIFFPKTKKKPNTKVKLLHISHLENRHKNITGILDAVKLLSEKRTDFELTVCGNRNLDFVRKYASKINIPKNIVFFEGKKTREEVAELMRAHDIFVLFSNFENLPCVISEAHMCGIPVISSDVGGISEMITKNNGVLIPPENLSVFVHSLSKMIDNLHKYFPENISSEAKKRYSYNVVGKKYFKIYNTVLKPKKTIA